MIDSNAQNATIPQEKSSAFPKNFCEICKTQFKKGGNRFKKHLDRCELKVKKGKFEKCKICHEKLFFNIKQHVEMCETYSSLLEQFDGRFRCKLCKFSDSYRAEVLKHMNRKHNSISNSEVMNQISQEPKCIYCNEQFKSGGNIFEEHIKNCKFKVKKVRTGKFEKCKICQEEYNVGIIIRQHEKLCETFSSFFEQFEGGLKCKFCLFHNYDRAEMLRHINKKHKKNHEQKKCNTQENNISLNKR